MLATLLLSQGVPMLSGGDEIGRTQRGNNNAYCQDNETSWYDWSSLDGELLALTRQLAQFRADHPVFRRRRFFQGHVDEQALPDIGWFRPDGKAMGDSDWRRGGGTAIAVFLNGHSLSLRTVADGLYQEPLVDDSYLILFNAGPERATFTVPPVLAGCRWSLLLDTATFGEGPPPSDPVAMIDVEVRAWTVVVLEREPFEL
jgi:glycogen operon protein